MASREERSPRRNFQTNNHQVKADCHHNTTRPRRSLSLFTNRVCKICCTTQHSTNNLLFEKLRHIMCIWPPLVRGQTVLTLASESNDGYYTRPNIHFFEIPCGHRLLAGSLPSWSPTHAHIHLGVKCTWITQGFCKFSSMGPWKHIQPFCTK